MSALHKGVLRMVVLVLIVQVGAKPALDIGRMLIASEMARLIFLSGVLVGAVVPLVAPRLADVITTARLYIAAIPMPGLERLNRQTTPAASASSASRKKAA